MRTGKPGCCGPWGCKELDTTEGLRKPGQVTSKDTKARTPKDGVAHRSGLSPHEEQWDTLSGNRRNGQQGTHGGVGEVRPMGKVR